MLYTHTNRPKQTKYKLKVTTKPKQTKYKPKNKTTKKKQTKTNK